MEKSVDRLSLTTEVRPLVLCKPRQRNRQQQPIDTTTGTTGFAGLVVSRFQDRAPKTEPRGCPESMDESQTPRAEDEHEPVLPSEQAALQWLKQVDGTVYHNRNNADGDSAWVAVVRTPAAHGKAGKIILAFGESVQEAAGAAEEEWDALWSSLSARH